ncbi:MAG: SUMF1/EgtB/PvdO family nonheme iron enzyme [Alistipes sp.]|nr:SUMF1/EgtB/PvdO family nonheme iron enzyme [Alistipes sp.]
MNKRLNVLLLLSGLLFMVAGCSKEDFDNGGNVTAGSGDIRFEIGFTPATRVATGADFTSAWEKGDAIGLFAYDANNNDLVFSNEKLTYDGSEWKSGNDLYWRGRSLKFYAYYPYDAAATDPAAIPLAVKSDQSGTTGEGDAKKSNYSLSDLMTATDASSGKSAGQTVSLTFRHEFAMIQVEVPAQGKGWGPGEAMTVSLKGVKTGATLDLTGGEAPAVQTSEGTGNVKMYLAGKPEDNGFDAYTYRAVIPVQTLKSGSDLFLISNEGALYKGGGPASELELQANRAEIFTRSLPDDIKSLHRVFIPAGAFTMGSPVTEPNRGNETQHEVILTRGFYMSKYEITNAQYAAFLNAVGVGDDGKWSDWSDDANKNQVLIKDCTKEYGGSYPWGLVWDTNGWKPAAGYEDHPVIYVTWYGAKAYADWIGGKLPTEAQWEYACRGGQQESLPFGIGDGTKLKAGMANYYIQYSYELPGGEFEDRNEHSNSYVGKTTAVGSYPYPNGYGLYDMHGNVWEWCLDSWDGSTAYSPEDATDPVSPNPGSFRVLRGGSWRYDAQDCRSAYRSGGNPDIYRNDIGFRVVFVP